jgi:hypothetical protein
MLEFKMRFPQRWLQTLLSHGILRRLVRSKSTDVSKKHVSILRAEESAKAKRWKQVVTTVTFHGVVLALADSSTSCVGVTFFSETSDDFKPAILCYIQERELFRWQDDWMGRTWEKTFLDYLRYYFGNFLEGPRRSMKTSARQLVSQPRLEASMSTVHV